jgi:hypothetical protein
VTLRVPLAVPDGLDAGISEFVRVLREHGIETFESCEGGKGHAFLEPTIRLYGQHEEGFRALAVALEHGLPVDSLRRYWTIIGGEPHGPRWELTFREKGSDAVSR